MYAENVINHVSVYVQVPSIYFKTYNMKNKQNKSSK